MARPNDMTAGSPITEHVHFEYSIWSRRFLNRCKVPATRTQILPVLLGLWERLGKQSCTAHHSRQRQPFPDGSMIANDDATWASCSRFASVLWALTWV